MGSNPIRHPKVNTSDYYYILPKELIAQAPAEPRDASRLMVYSAATDEIVFDDFANLGPLSAGRFRAGPE